MADYILVPLLTLILSLGADLVAEKQRDAQKQEQQVSQESQEAKENQTPIDTKPPSLYN